LALEKRCEEQDHAVWQKRVEAGESQWQLEIGGRKWRVRAQRNLGESQGIHVMSRPDFTFEPVDGDPAIRPVAVFCDGFAYHVQPELTTSRLSDDIRKRRSIVASGHWLQWSVTWSDVQEFQGTKTAITSMLDDTDARRLQVLHDNVGGALDRSEGLQGNLLLLWTYLTNPDSEAWVTQAHLRAVAWAVSGPFLAAGAADLVETGLLQSVGPLSKPNEQQTPDPALVARYKTRVSVALIVRTPAAALDAGNLYAARAVLRLYDDQQRRGAEGFETDWRVFLQAWNLLQFVPELEVVDTEGLDLFEADRLQRQQTAQAVKVRTSEQREGQPSMNLDDLRELTGAAGRLILDKLIATDTPIQRVPEVGFELAGAHGTAGPEAELAWPDQKVAVLVEEQLYDRAAFESAGWSVVADAPIDDMVYRVNTLLSDSGTEEAR
jgi:DEAD/DEAH box helicase domain-containing protein